LEELFIFDVPVYRIERSQYYKDLNLHIERTLFSGDQFQNEQKKKFYSKYPENKRSIEEHIRDSYGGAWDYNEIIGWIKLHFLGNQIRGEYWKVKSKRIVRTRKKLFEWYTWKLAPEMEIPENSNNAKIFTLIKKYLAECSKEKEIKGRHLDTSILDHVGPYIDWRSLLNKSK
jgi:hypothetical protein